MQKFLIGLVVAGLAAAMPAHAQQAASEVYQWKDASGTTHYSQTPPPKGAFQVRKITNAGAAPASGTANASAAAGTATGTTAATASASASANAPAGGGSKDCQQARANVTALTSKGQVQQDTDGDGKPDTTLNDAQRASQLNLAQAAVQAYCTP